MGLHTAASNLRAVSGSFPCSSPGGPPPPGPFNRNASGAQWRHAFGGSAGPGVAAPTVRNV
eukprot:4658198-Alexandrium_andersonii.AAC.1